MVSFMTIDFNSVPFDDVNVSGDINGNGTTNKFTGSWAFTQTVGAPEVETGFLNADEASLNIMEILPTIPPIIPYPYNVVWLPDLATRPNFGNETFAFLSDTIALSARIEMLERRTVGNAESTSNYSIEDKRLHDEEIVRDAVCNEFASISLNKFKDLWLEFFVSNSEACKSSTWSKQSAFITVMFKNSVEPAEFVQLINCDKTKLDIDLLIFNANNYGLNRFYDQLCNDLLENPLTSQTI